MDGDILGQVAYLVLLLIFIGGWVAVEYRQRLGAMVRTLLAWGMIFFAVMVGYGLWQDMRGQIGGFQQVTEAGTLEIPRAPDGHYYPVAEVDGTRVKFMVDTGATNIVLTKEDARRIGIDLGSLVFDGVAETANGPVRSARVVLDSLKVGPFVDRGVTAWVNEGEMFGSLLGMDYLRGFTVTIDKGTMVLAR